MNVYIRTKVDVLLSTVAEYCPKGIERQQLVAKNILLESVQMKKISNTLFINCKT